MKPTRREFSLLKTLALFVCLCLAGCGGFLKQPPLSRAYFAIDPGRPDLDQTSSGHDRLSGPVSTTRRLTVLRVRALRVSPPYDGLAFVYRTGPSQFDTDFYNNFIAPPASLLTGQLIQWLAESCPMVVCDVSSDLRSDMTLEGNLTALYIDSTAPMSPRAVIAARFFLTRDKNGATELLWQKSYGASAAVADRSPARFAQAWGAAYRQLLTELSRDLCAFNSRR